MNQKNDTNRLAKAIAFLLPLLLIGSFFTTTPRATADSISDLQQKITENNQKIAELEKQISSYSTLLNKASKETQTLKTTLQTLDLTQKKLEANLALTATQITKTTLTIESLASDISDTESNINKASQAVSQSIREMAMAESQSPVEDFLKNKSISETWDYLNALRTIQNKIALELDDLKTLHSNLGTKKTDTEAEKAKLVTYQKNLSDQKKAVAAAKAEKDQLLKDTQNNAAKYQAQLAEASKQKEIFERELFNYEAQLKITIDPTSIPAGRSGLFSWPLDSIYVTQYFGKTVAAKRLYVSGTHGGMDFRASIGTPVKAVLSGIVTDTEAVKIKSGCQYGKWVLIRHPNGLSTIYGHLSVVSVVPGESVSTGDIIGYSGNTGYTTGPHLHLGTYVTAGIRIVDAAALGSTSCKGIKTVAADPAAYLDPLVYLPSL